MRVPALVALFLVPLLSSMSVTASLETTSVLIDSKAPPAEPVDKYLWQEDVTAKRSLDWVRKQNAASQKQLTGSNEFVKLRDDIKDILDSDIR